MKFLLTLSLLFVAFNSSAVVKRHDVEPEMYQLDEVPEFYVDMPFQGGAVLIDKHWLLAPAHVIYTFMYDYEGKPIMVHGVENQIADIILHPDYSRVGGESAESKKLSLFEQLNNNKDIALIRLASAVSHIKPIAIYAGDDELGMETTGFGRGAIGTGLSGEIEDSEGPSLITYGWYQVTKFFTDWVFTQEDYQLHVYNNVITAANDQWLRFTFEQGEDALPLEGTIGSGDSGGAVVIYKNTTPVLVGLAAWREFDGDVERYTFGKYGSTAVLTRVSYFQAWISNYIEDIEFVSK